MSKKSVIFIPAKCFRWTLRRRDGIYYADGRRGNPGVKLGRYSLQSSCLDDARTTLIHLDAIKAVEQGRVDRSVLEQQHTTDLSLEDGIKKYMTHVSRSSILGGARVSTVKRYRAVFDKLIKFAHANGVNSCNQCGRRLLESYISHLDDEDYAKKTQYLEVTTLKQTIKWLLKEKLIPDSCSFDLRVKKPAGTTTYCYTAEEVSAMSTHCAARADLKWLGDVIDALAHTGFRISELVSLRWSDVDDMLTRINLVDETRTANQDARSSARSTKTGEDRVVPVHQRLHDRLRSQKSNPHKDGRVFHGPKGGLLKPDTVRNILVREVLLPLAPRFSKRGLKGFVDGRLHSFRHFFCSTCANEGTSEQLLMSWLGHRDSKMVRYYYHLNDKESQRQMNSITFIADTVSGVLPPDKAA